ncbi:2-oxo acid dehydrogenase subunit E2 [Catenulispora sp. NF23]|uniref:dihydrolipoamide acetyltransferase family protein n=1 Tax=Catenulispora pinistramenti TaxID=2705254 RepID=UPI001BA715CC|nr:dihydrolipoamide acetyltransferase family protein [Catenulispora pinistramenti]MBS2531346.1 2-oxo acid dehydrogenase subunit E2 [Catenulispora pinistramenti]
MGEIKRFNLPDVGEGLTEAEILAWSVKVGDIVKVNQILVEIETAKAAVELPSPWAGKIVELLVSEGQTVDVGTPIIGIDIDPSTPSTGGAAGGDDMTAGVAATAEAKAAPPAEKEKREAVLVGYGVKQAAAARRPRKTAAAPSAADVMGASLREEPVVDDVPAPAYYGQPAGRETAAPAVRAPASTVSVTPAAPSAPIGAKPLAKPPVRKLAKDLGVDLASVVPTGVNGTVTREDVHAAASGTTQTAPSAGTAAPAAPAAPFVNGERRVPIRGVRKATAAAMVQSKFTAPHVTEFLTVDVTPTMKFVQRLKEMPDFKDVRVSPLLLVAKAFLVAMARNPEINARWDEANGEIVYFDHVSLGIAAATPRGLLVPNIKGADLLPLVELGRALNALTAVAREGKTSLADMTGATATITNVGVFGVDTGTPILNPGEASILAFGAVREQPWVHKGKVKPRQVTTLALSFDHRLVDGELGSKVLRDIGAVLADPLTALAWS